MRNSLAFTIGLPRWSTEGRMRRWWATGGLLGLLIFGGSFFPAFAGDSCYGKAQVKSAQVVVVGCPGESYDVRIIGIEVPQDGPLARQAQQFVRELVDGKNVRIRFEYRAPNGEMVSRLFTDDPAIGIQEVGVELLKAGLARRQPNYDYKYGELSKAEREAQVARRGLWASAQPK